LEFDWSNIIRRNPQSISAKDLREFETNIGFDLPQDYRDFLLRFNGGQVLIDHEIRVVQSPFALGVNYFLPFTAPSPSMGIVETRDIQERHHLCLRQAIEVADDMGTGCYYLMLAGESRGAVYFVWRDERPILSNSDWENWEVIIPTEMFEVSPSFDTFGKFICLSRSR
jgi:hypothetical protein